MKTFKNFLIEQKFDKNLQFISCSNGNGEYSITILIDKDRYEYILPPMNVQELYDNLKKRLNNGRIKKNEIIIKLENLSNKNYYKNGKKQ